MSAAPPPSSDSTVTITGTTWDGTAHQDTIAASEAQTAPSRSEELPVPTAVWGVIAAFVVLLLGLVGA